MQKSKHLKTLMPGLLVSMMFWLVSIEAATTSPQMDWTPPDFEISEPDGNIFNYPESLEKPTIILFWATWCPYCKALMPHLQSIIDEYPGQVQVLALNFKDDDDPALYLEERGYDFRLILHSEEVAQSWGVKGTPGLFLANPAGRVLFSRGAIPAEAYRPDSSENDKPLKHYQKAARRAPLWAARLRMAIDQLLSDQANTE